MVRGAKSWNIIQQISLKLIDLCSYVILNINIYSHLNTYCQPNKYIYEASVYIFTYTSRSSICN